MDKFTTITVEQRDAIEILSLNRPEALNAVTPGDGRRVDRLFFGASRSPDHAHRDLPRQWTGVLRRGRTRFGCVRSAWRGATAAAARHAAALLADHPPDAKLPAADRGACSRCGMRGGLFAAAGLRRALCHAGSADECRLHTCRRRRLRHGIRLSVASADRPFRGFRTALDRTVSRRGSGQGRRPCQRRRCRRSNCWKPGSHSLPKWPTPRRWVCA